MSNLIRWEPMREMMTLREAMNQLFDESFTQQPGMAGSLRTPAIDLYQTEDDVVFKAALPGLKPGDVQISITGEQLTLRGEYKQESEKKDATYHIREQRFGSFERTVTLPTLVKTDDAKAEFENGILTVTLPKAEAVKPKSVQIKVK